MERKLRRTGSVVFACLAVMTLLATTSAFAQGDKPVCPPMFGEPGFFQLTDEGKIELSVVVDAPGQTKDQLYSRARAWFFAEFEGKQLSVGDKELGKLEAWMDSHYGSNRVHINLNLQIVVRDGESEISMRNLYAVYTYLIQGRWGRSTSPLEKLFQVEKPHKKYKKTGEMIKARRVDCEYLVEYGTHITQSFSEAIKREEAAGKVAE